MLGIPQLINYYINGFLVGEGEILSDRAAPCGIFGSKKKKENLRFLELFLLIPSSWIVFFSRIILSLLPKLSLSGPAVAVCITREAWQKQEFEAFTLPVRYNVRLSPGLYHRRNISIGTVAHLPQERVLPQPLLF